MFFLWLCKAGEEKLENYAHFQGLSFDGFNLAFAYDPVRPTLVCINMINHIVRLEFHLSITHGYDVYVVIHFFLYICALFRVCIGLDSRGHSQKQSRGAVSAGIRHRPRACWSVQHVSHTHAHRAHLTLVLGSAPRSHS